MDAALKINEAFFPRREFGPKRKKADRKRETNEKYKWFNGSEVLLGRRHTHYKGISAINLKFLLLHLLLL